MSNKTENPSAFPWANDADKQYNWIHRGMTLRDYFAAKAMQALISKVNINTTQGVLITNFKRASVSAYWVADEMLKAREL